MKRRSIIPIKHEMSSSKNWWAICHRHHHLSSCCRCCGGVVSIRLSILISYQHATETREKIAPAPALQTIFDFYQMVL